MTAPQNLHHLFADHQRGRGASPATVRRRQLTLRAFERHLAPLTLLDATAELAEEFVHHYRAPATRRAYRADLKAFYRWARRRKLCDSNPIDETDAIRVPRGLPRPVDPAVVPMLIATARDWETTIAIGLAAYAGLRCAEIAALDGSDLVLLTDPAMLIVRGGKGGKDRAVPVHTELVRMLARLGPGPLISIQSDSLGRKVSRHMRAQGVDATIHKLRHTFGTEAARASNGNLLIVADLMGHESLTTTGNYTKLAGTGTAGTIASMYPAAA